LRVVTADGTSRQGVVFIPSRAVIIIERCPCGEYVPPSCPDCLPVCRRCSQ